MLKKHKTIQFIFVRPIKRWEDWGERHSLLSFKSTFSTFESLKSLFGSHKVINYMYKGP